MFAIFATPEFWVGLGVIIWVNIILSGDNAVVIALAARSLPKHQQKQAIFWGAGAGGVLGLALPMGGVRGPGFPYLKLSGGAGVPWVRGHAPGAQVEHGVGQPSRWSWWARRSPRKRKQGARPTRPLPNRVRRRAELDAVQRGVRLARTG